NAGEAQARLAVKGSDWFATTARSGPVQVSSRGSTNFSAEKMLRLEGIDILSSAPISSASTHTNTTGISTDLPRLRGRISLRIASCREAENHGLVESITSERTRRRLERAFDGLVQDRTAE